MSWGEPAGEAERIAEDILAGELGVITTAPGVLNRAQAIAIRRLQERVRELERERDAYRPRRPLGGLRPPGASSSSDTENGREP